MDSMTKRVTKEFLAILNKRIKVQQKKIEAELAAITATDWLVQSRKNWAQRSSRLIVLGQEHHNWMLLTKLLQGNPEVLPLEIRQALDLHDGCTYGDLLVFGIDHALERMRSKAFQQQAVLEVR